MKDSTVIKQMAIIYESMIDENLDVDKNIANVCEAEEHIEQLKDQQKTLDQYFDESRKTGKTLIIEFIKKGTGEMRRAEVYNKSKYGPSIYFKGKHGKEYLSDITASGDEIYNTDINVEDAYIVFFEKIPEESVQDALDSKYSKYIQNPEEGVYTWYRSFYANNVKKIIFDGNEVWNSDSGSNILDKNVTSRRVLTRQEIEHANEMRKKAEEDRKRDEEDRKRREEENAALMKEAEKLAATLTEKDVEGVYHMANAHVGDSREERLRWEAIRIAHDRLMKENPEKHVM